MSGRPTGSIEWVREGTALFEAAVMALAGAGLSQPSLLPGWTRRHVVAHVACNADALVNLMRWAATGVESPMYASREQRAAEIEEWAGRPVDQLLAHMRAAHDRLALAFGTLPDENWSATVRTAAGRLIQADEVPWLRVREVWVHRVDLGAGTTMDDAPDDVLEALVQDVVGNFAARPDVPALELAATGSGRRWWTGPHDVTRSRIAGDLAALAGYLTGRPSTAVLVADPEPAPTLPAWL